MTDIDTAAIRAGSYPIDGMTDSCRGYDEAARFLLCEALDAARAERDDWHSIATSPTLNERMWKARAEAAEARLAKALKALTAADGMCANCYHGDAAGRALTRGNDD